VAVTFGVAVLTTVVLVAGLGVAVAVDEAVGATVQSLVARWVAVALVLGVVTGVVVAAVGFSALGVAVACGHPVERGSVGSSVGVQLDVEVALGCEVWMGNGHHVGHQLGLGEVV
jgi:hypothetical protein